MHEYGIYSLLPSLLAILCAILTRRVLLSLFIGIGVGQFVLADYHPFATLYNIAIGLWETLTTPSNLYIVLFTLAISLLLGLIQYSGGMMGMAQVIQRLLSSAAAYNKKNVQLMATATGMVLFIETNISILSTSILFRPLFDHLNISRKRLAYICDSTSSPMCILLPFNAWGGAIIGILILQAVEEPVLLFLQATLFNFYALAALATVFVSILFFARGKSSTKPPLQPLHSIKPTPATSAAKATNMYIPMACMLLGMPTWMVLTGYADAEGEGAAWLFDAFLHGQAPLAILLSVIGALVIAWLYYYRQGLLKTNAYWGAMFKEGVKIVPVMVLCTLVFNIGDVCRGLQTGAYIAQYAAAWDSKALLPVLFFLISAICSFSTGTSWGTFSIILPLVIPVCSQTGADIPLCLGAVLGGSVFGDHASPISDTTVISAFGAGCTTIDHVRHQLPYALLAAGAASVGYVLLGFWG